MKVVVDGNDGTGKSTLCAALRARGIEAADRGAPTRMTDDETVRPEADAFYLILDAPVDVCRERLARAGKDLDERYHTVQDLEHYRRRFLEVAQGLPHHALVDATGAPEQVLQRCLEALREAEITPIAESPFYVEFLVDDEERWARLAAVVDALKHAKETGTLQPSPTWRTFFDERALAHFWWPTEAERRDWHRRWQATPVPQRWTDPSLATPWDFDSLIEAFANGEYRLLGLRRTGQLARLEFDPHAHPYGGTGYMVALVEAFDFRVGKIAD